MESPLVSIIIPVYNGENYMREAIDSALNQTYENKEILVINDGSSDRTDEIAKSYGDKIRYFPKENGGSSSALNVGIKNMKGEIFSWLSHDDLYLPERTEEMMKSYSGNQSEILLCRVGFIDADGKDLVYAKKGLSGHYTGKEMLELFANHRGINGCSVLVPKTLIDKVGFFDETLVYVNDLDYWYRTIFAGAEFTYVEKSLIKTRIHPGQVSVKKKNLYKTERHRLAKKNLEKLENDASLRDFAIPFLKVLATDAETEVLKKGVKSLEIPTFERAKLNLKVFRGKLYTAGKTVYKKIFFKR